MQLSNALYSLVKSRAMQYLKAQIIKRTVFAALSAALSPTAWLQVGQIIGKQLVYPPIAHLSFPVTLDNPWMMAKTRATKTGQVLGTLLAQRVLGNRPITLVGYSLGAQVIFEALQFLASLPPEQTAPLVQDVFLFGTPVSTDEGAWAAVRRVVSGRVVNGYSKDDYILAVLARASGATWGVAGLQAVEVQGVENVECKEVDGHMKWRGMVGRCLQMCEAPGVLNSEVELQLKNRGKKIAEEMDMSERDAQNVIDHGDGTDR